METTLCLQRTVSDESWGFVLRPLRNTETNSPSPNGISGIYVHKVKEGSLAQSYGLRFRDLVLEVDGHPIYSVEEASSLVKASGTCMLLKIRRQGRPSEVKQLPFPPPNECESTERAASSSPSWDGSLLSATPPPIPPRSTVRDQQKVVKSTPGEDNLSYSLRTPSSASSSKLMRSLDHINKQTSSHPRLRLQNVYDEVFRDPILPEYDPLRIDFKELPTWFTETAGVTDVKTGNVKSLGVNGFHDTVQNNSSPLMLSSPHGSEKANVDCSISEGDPFSEEPSLIEKKVPFIKKLRTYRSEEKLDIGEESLPGQTTTSKLSTTGGRERSPSANTFSKETTEQEWSALQAKASGTIFHDNIGLTNESELTRESVYDRLAYAAQCRDVAPRLAVLSTKHSASPGPSLKHTNHDDDSCTSPLQLSTSSYSKRQLQTSTELTANLRLRSSRKERPRSREGNPLGTDKVNSSSNPSLVNVSTNRPPLKTNDSQSGLTPGPRYQSFLRHKFITDSSPFISKSLDRDHQMRDLSTHSHDQGINLLLHDPIKHRLPFDSEMAGTKFDGTSTNNSSVNKHSPSNEATVSTSLIDWHKVFQDAIEIHSHSSFLILTKWYYRLASLQEGEGASHENQNATSDECDPTLFNNSANLQEYLSILRNRCLSSHLTLIGECFLDKVLINNLVQNMQRTFLTYDMSSHMSDSGSTKCQLLRDISDCLRNTVIPDVTNYCQNLQKQIDHLQMHTKQFCDQLRISCCDTLADRFHRLMKSLSSILHLLCVQGKQVSEWNEQSSNQNGAGGEKESCQLFNSRCIASFNQAQSMASKILENEKRLREALLSSNGTSYSTSKTSNIAAILETDIDAVSLFSVDEIAEHLTLWVSTTLQWEFTQTILSQDQILLKKLSFALTSN